MRMSNLSSYRSDHTSCTSADDSKNIQAQRSTAKMATNEDDDLFADL